MSVVQMKIEEALQRAFPVATQVIKVINYDRILCNHPKPLRIYSEKELPKLDNLDISYSSVELKPIMFYDESQIVHVGICNVCGKLYYRSNCQYIAVNMKSYSVTSEKQLYTVGQYDEISEAVGKVSKAIIEEEEKVIRFLLEHYGVHCNSLLGVEDIKKEAELKGLTFACEYEAMKLCKNIFMYKHDELVEAWTVWIDLDKGRIRVKQTQTQLPPYALFR